MEETINLKKIKNAARKLAKTSEKQRNLFLTHLAKVLCLNQKKIIKANKEDVYNAKTDDLSSAFIERLTMTKIGIQEMVLRLRELERLESRLGEIIGKKIMADGLILKKIKVPLGVIIVIYEARPEVTIDVASLCIKSGNAAILKGGSEAVNTNQILYKCILFALEKSGLSKDTINFISTNNRRIINNLLTRNDYIDLVIARGGYGLVRAVLSKSTIPVLAHAAGGARIYIDKSADFSIIKQIIINAKTSKPSACNSLDTILVHKEIAFQLIPQLLGKLRSYEVKVVGDSLACKLVKINRASDKDWDKEFLGLKLAIKVVDNVREAVEFINKHSKHHSEGIIASDKKIIDYFVKSIDSAAIFINCSTRLHDGYVFGLGGEVGIATGKLHVRGPVGLQELMTYKWIVEGKGHLRH